MKYKIKKKHLIILFLAASNTILAQQTKVLITPELSQPMKNGYYVQDKEDNSKKFFLYKNSKNYEVNLMLLDSIIKTQDFAKIKVNLNNHFIEEIKLTGATSIDDNVCDPKKMVECTASIEHFIKSHPDFRKHENSGKQVNLSIGQTTSLINECITQMRKDNFDFLCTNGCQVIAEYINQFFDKKGIETKKAFYMSKVEGKCVCSSKLDIKWKYHVAPIIKVNKTEYVIDMPSSKGKVSEMLVTLTNWEKTHFIKSSTDTLIIHPAAILSIELGVATNNSTLTTFYPKPINTLKNKQNAILNQ
ncbi:protein-glutamine glutaminase family protein [Emticicia sp. W12TSBA100-4]|uniref:protein-glutamine glutaminase family protein n=1 Tax=Emticicia sp. W12TSBA100-4 TaxID=3160965 RepID=UPI003305CFDF